MNIDPSNKLQVNATSRITPEQSPRQQAVSAPAVAGTTDVNQVSTFSKTVESTYQSLTEANAVDMKKVRQLQHAIITGHLPLDDDSLIDAMLEMHKK
ncbi:flagellar biosynthesis anti-sigma factor FlgM [Chromatiaceae bacterium AAb-1]|nr:flagellar biosynthesis anti-sigma factor FlgM [Chromatiaceae bacterium AAb-1]